MLVKAARALLSASLLTAFIHSLSLPVTAQVVDNNTRLTIGSSVHRLAQPSHDAGPVDGGTSMERLLLVLGPNLEQERALKAFVDSQHDRRSLNYHQWLTPEEFNLKFGPSAEDVEKVRNWLEEQGFAVGRTARGGRWIEFSGTARQVERAFQTQMRQYQVAGGMHIANATEVSIPAALAPVVRGVLSLHSFFSKPLLTPPYQAHRDDQGQWHAVNLDPHFTFPSEGVNFHFLTPGDYTKIYDLGPLYQAGADGSGQTIAIVGRSKVELTDIELFRQLFNLPAADPNMIVNGTDPGFTFSGDSVEATLDVEWAGAVAPKATIDLVVSASTATTDGVDLSAAYIVDNNLAPVMSVSFGACEKDLGAAENAFWNALWQQAAAQGISVLVSSGDNGAAGCDDPNDFIDLPAQGGLAVSGLASTPFNTAVGGTAFNENGNDSTFWSLANTAGFASAVGYIPETVWNESCDPTVATSPCAAGFFDLFAGSGGASSLYAKPSWQSTSILGVPNDNKRDVPDVSMAAAAGHDGYLFCFFGSCQTTTDSTGNVILINASVVGGTSASAPSFAGLMAIVDQQVGSRQGLPNYILYPLAAQETFANCNSSSRTNPSVPSTCVFNDTTAGNNNVPGQTGFTAVTGYDLATGLGSVDAANLVNAWVNQVKGLTGTKTLLVANGTTTAQHGQPISFTFTVQPASGTAVPTGNVALVSDLAGPVPGSVQAIGSAGPLDNNGNVTASFSNLPGGQYNVIAHYPGDSSFQGSNSSPLAVNISKENSSTTLQSFVVDQSTGNLVAGTSANYGDFVDVHGSVVSASGKGFATGTYTIKDGSVQLGSLPLNNLGQVDLISSGFGAPLTFTVGTHTLSASYSGDNSLNSSATAQSVAITINKATPSVFLNASAFNILSTQPVVLVAQVFNTGPILPTGTVQFVDGTASLGQPVPVTPPSPGAIPQGAIQVTLSAGKHNIGANYSGDSTYNTAAAAFTIPITVTAPSGTPFQFLAPGGTTVTVAAGQAGIFNLSLVANGGFTGTVGLTCSGVPLGLACAVNPNSVNLSASLTSAPLTVTVAPSSSSQLKHDGLRSWPLVLAGLLAGVLSAAGRKPRKPLAVLLAIVMVAGLGSCGGGGNTIPPITFTTSTITVTGTSGNVTNSIALTLRVSH